MSLREAKRRSNLKSKRVLGIAAPAKKHRGLAMTATAFIFLFQSISFAAWTPSKISISTKDGTKLVALFQKPQAGKPIVVCLHGLAATKEEWTPFAKVMADRGWGVLTYDSRGHGESSMHKDSKGDPDGFKYLSEPDWIKMIDDVGAVVHTVRSSVNDSIPVYLAGASVGANVALNYASLTQSIRAVVLLSPGQKYVVFQTEDPIKSIRCPVLMVASSADAYAFQTLKLLKSIQPHATAWSDVKPGHGVQMFDDVLLKRIATWLESH